MSEGSGARPEVTQSTRASRIFCPGRTHVDAWQILTTRAHFLVFISFMKCPHTMVAVEFYLSLLIKRPHLTLNKNCKMGVSGRLNKLGV